MNDTKKKVPTSADTAITRRHMLMRLGLAAGAIYAAPVMLPLTDARASSFSPPSGPRRRTFRHNQGSWSAPSFSGPSRHRRPAYGAQQVQPRPRRRTRPRRRIRVGSFSR